MKFTRIRVMTAVSAVAILGLAACNSEPEAPATDAMEPAATDTMAPAADGTVVAVAQGTPTSRPWSAPSSRPSWWIP
ncbi:MAG: hypothetical protein V7672_14480 [Brevundimonas sp.]|uniref:hypothetical protein n=1 Tax=Brevundimonas sp. TaxID=1871086 RepID=UPI0030026C8E